MIQIFPLNRVSIETIHQAFTEAFADYAEPFTLDVSQLQYMIERRGYRPELSFGAFERGKLIGFTLNGAGIWNNQQTAYDTGTGVIQAWRQQGIAGRILEESLPMFREKGITRYLLEVIRTNSKAFELYQKAGFRVSREFNYYVSAKSELKVSEKQLPSPYTPAEIGQPDWQLLKTFWDFTPSWQNSIDSILRKRSSFAMLGVFLEQALVGYGIVEKETGDIPQFAVKPDFRRQGIGTVLFRQLVDLSASDRVKVINTECHSASTSAFLERINLASGPGQYEMILKL